MRQFSNKAPHQQSAAARTSGRHATWLELFFDLVFVVAIAQAVHDVKDNPTIEQIIKDIALFLPVWWIWAMHTIYATRFDIDDLFYRLMTFGTMFSVAVLAVGLNDFDADKSLLFGVSYVAARLLLWVLLWRVHIHLPEMRNATPIYLSGFGLSILFWIASFSVSPPERYLLWGIGFSIDFITPWIAWWRKLVVEVPVDTTHIPERFGLLNIIVLGEAVFGIVEGVTEEHRTLVVFLTAGLGFISAVAIWWTYFSYLEAASDKLSIGAGQPYMYCHIPFVVGVAAIGIGIEKLILSAHQPVASSGGVLIYCGGAILWALAFYAIQWVSAPQLITRRVTWLFSFTILAFIAVAGFDDTLPSIIAQSAITGIFLLLLVISSHWARSTRS